MNKIRWSLAQIGDKEVRVLPSEGPDYGTFYGPNAERNANLWAHGFPALLEAVQRFFRADPILDSERGEARAFLTGYANIRVALYDAMKACEPPPKTRRERVAEIVAELAELPDRVAISPETYADRILAITDEEGVR